MSGDDEVRDASKVVAINPPVDENEHEQRGRRYDERPTAYEVTVDQTATLV